MKFVAISDTHGKHLRLKMPEGDVLLHAGDFSMMGKALEILDFNRWLRDQPYKYKVIIPGNHDLGFEEDWAWACSLLDDDVIVLNQSSVEIEGIRIWGEPRQPKFFDWAFNVPRSQMAEQCWDKVPEDTDVLLTHGPPHGCGDRARDIHSDAIIHVGCTAQRKFLSAHERIKVVVCGHIHGGYGIYGLGNKRVYNASVVNERYQVVNNPIVFEMTAKNPK